MLQHDIVITWFTYTTQSRFLMTLKKKAFGNIVGKGKNAGIQHFLLFPQCLLPCGAEVSSFGSPLVCRLQMLSIWTNLKFCGLVKSWKHLKVTDMKFPLMILQLFDRIENIMGKGENAVNQHFLFSHSVFLRVLSLGF